MKGVKAMSAATGTIKRFQSDDILTQRVHLPGGVELGETLAKMTEENKKMTEENKKMAEENKKMTDLVKELALKVKDLQDKYDTLVVE